jgi:LysM repeat protein
VSHITTNYPILNLPDATRPGFVLAVSPILPTGVTQPTYATQPTYTTQPAIAGQRTHLVQRGENLFRISLRYGVNMYTLARVNGIVNINLIYAGQVLIIP